ncbi:uncharacterized protein I303_100929 [Kwoniella dejecticola CBS 10117]|uniref:Dihydrodipicolinate synthetase n=1 Tax=Kwoniella dejecticola CBS 10117 TaxID=1296121 RepID=A0A1A6AGE0_9TREE|nr:dihydrodipicolinate synthetase [Kwoniella dejecticola CBS 10117]OBR89111.1 dihydrodipicolinate synthetase [Kwoniella dejecticola CBS 10117]
MPIAIPADASSVSRLPPGIYCPTVTFFKATEEQELDLDLHVKHMTFLARSGLSGVVLQGSTAEAVALDPEERKILISTAKKAFIEAGNTGKIIAGTVGAQSLREAIKLCRDAFEAGADFALSLPPAYYPSAMTAESIQGFYEDLADKSPIPIIIYSYPGVCNGLQLDTDLICRLARHPNVAGVKHTDHDVGRIARETAYFKANEMKSPFTILGGATDYLLGSMAVGGQGAITGMANVAPRVCMKAFELSLQGKHEEALEYAQAISQAEWGMGKGGILGTKYMTTWANSYPSESEIARKPLAICPEATKEHCKSVAKLIVDLERRLEKESWAGQNLGPTTVSNGSAKKSNGINNLVETVKDSLEI